MVQIILKDIDLTPILNAQSVFKKFLTSSKTDQEKAGTIQAFEFCYEIAWRLMKRILMHKGVETASPRDAFREAAKNKLIDDPKVWFLFQEQRNLTVHTYNKIFLEEIMAFLPQFDQELDRFVERIQSL